MDNLAFGLRITFVGMGLVFALLALLWLLLAAIGRLDALSVQKAREEAAPAPSPAPEPPDPGMDPDFLAAVTVAVVAYATARRREGAPSMRATAPGSQLFASRWLAAGRARQTGPWTGKG